MSVADMENDTHAVIRPTSDFSEEQLGKFNGVMFALQKTKFVPLASIMLVIDGVGYRAHPTGRKETVNEDVRCIVYHVDPTPCEVKT